MAVYRLRVPKTKIGYGLRTLSTVAENEDWLRFTDSFYGLRGMVYGLRVLKKGTWFKGCVAVNGCQDV